MKAYHYLLIIAAILGVLYYMSTKKTTKAKGTNTSNKKEDDKTKTENYDEKDTSAYADVATIETKEAIALVENSPWSYMIADSENLNEGLGFYYELYVGEDWNNSERFIISERTYNALKDIVTELDYN